MIFQEGALNGLISFLQKQKELNICDQLFKFKFTPPLEKSCALAREAGLIPRFSFSS